jgi:hypothetical protein
MSRRLLISVFNREEDLVAACDLARRQRLSIVDAFTPCAVHGLDAALGLPPSRLAWVSLACGLAGALLALWFQFWTSAVNWPINVGGKPWNSWPAFVPVVFEMMVLCAGVGVFVAFLLLCRLYPGKKGVVPLPGVTDARFVLVLEESDAAFDAGRVRELFRACGVVQVEEVEVG